MVDEGIDYGWYSIYHARRGDVPSIHDIDAISFVSTVSTEWIEKRREHFRDRFFIAKKHSDDKIIGFLTSAHENYYPDLLPGFVYISRFAVAERHRRCGVGTSLLTTLYDTILPIKQYRGVVADVRKSNIPSLKFFLNKHDFIKHPVYSVPNWYERGNTPDDKYKIVVYKQFL